MSATVFIDGEVGTTGLQIRGRLQGRDDIQLLSLSEEHRKDSVRRAEMLNTADVSILCLPDVASREAVSMIENPNTRVIDASNAHRVTPGWVYGMPEYTPEQRELIATAKRVTNPGCYACSAVALLNPLVSARLLPASYPVTINAISGYSGGGRQMIERFEKSGTPDPLTDPYFVYGLGLEHKHVEEIRYHGGLENRPLFVPSVGKYAQGMIVQLPLQLWSLPGNPSVDEIFAAYAVHYAGASFIKVVSPDEDSSIERLTPEVLNGTNQMHLHIFGNQDRGQVVVMALLDNLGKGASGQAVQNLNIMLGLPESTELV